jgi:hypothetical protein
MVAPMKIDTCARTTEVLTKHGHSTEKKISILWNQSNTWMLDFMGLTFTRDITVWGLNDDQIILIQQSRVLN